MTPQWRGSPESRPPKYMIKNIEMILLEGETSASRADRVLNKGHSNACTSLGKDVLSM